MDAVKEEGDKRRPQPVIAQCLGALHMTLLQNPRKVWLIDNALLYRENWGFIPQIRRVLARHGLNESWGRP